MSDHELRLAHRLGELKARETLLTRCCRDYEQECDELRREITRLRRGNTEEGRESAPPQLLLGDGRAA
jgi:hypothetical protein